MPRPIRSEHSTEHVRDALILKPKYNSSQSVDSSSSSSSSEILARPSPKIGLKFELGLGISIYIIYFSHSKFYLRLGLSNSILIQA